MPPLYTIIVHGSILTLHIKLTEFITSTHLCFRHVHHLPSCPCTSGCLVRFAILVYFWKCWYYSCYWFGSLFMDCIYQLYIEVASFFFSFLCDISLVVCNMSERIHICVLFINFMDHSGERRMWDLHVHLHYLELQLRFFHWQK